MRKALLIIFFILCVTIFSNADQKLANLITEKKFETIASIFTDSSYKVLKPYFKKYTEIAFDFKTTGQIMYFVKFNKYAEVGLVLYQKKKETYSELKLKRLIQPLFFINKFNKYFIKNLQIKIGDATIDFQKGYIYQIYPLKNLFLFTGNWTFKIKPRDEEERLTLKYMFKNETFKKNKKIGIFLINEIDFFKNLKVLEEVNSLNFSESKDIFEIFKKEFGIFINPLNQYWYLSFSQSLNMVLFKKSKKSYYKYYFNKNISPDTILVYAPKNKYLLSYNINKKLKFSTSIEDRLKKIKLNLYYTPSKQFLSGTSILHYADPSDIKKIQLEENLTIRGLRDLEDKRINYLKKDDLYYIMGEKLKKIALYFSGKVLTDNPENAPFNPAFPITSNKNFDNYFILGKDQNIIPKPDNQFFESIISISLPSNLNCLASGQLIGRERVSDRNIFKFKSNGTTDVSIIYGNFKKLFEIPSKIPIHIYGSKNLSLKNYFEPDELQKYFDFLLELYGKLDIPELNVLFRRWRDFGGISHNGFIVFNIANLYIPWTETTRRIMRRDTPVVFSKKINRDNLIHELAHQWWGDVVSWKSFRDIWILEGAAHFSSLLYLESTIPQKNFLNIIERKIKSWVLKNKNAGPLIYGKRIANLTDNHIAYQSIIYNKATLVFFMLREMLGKKEFFLRIRKLLKKFRYRSISTRQFIRSISQNNSKLINFFNQWVYSRKIPTVKKIININGNTAEISFSQQETNFIFPLTLLITTDKETKSQNIIIDKKNQKFIITESSPIRSIIIKTNYAPIEFIK